MVDPVFVAMAVALALFFFFLYLLVRRTLVGFREGYEGGREE